MIAAIAIGYPIFTAGALIFRAVWARNAWGSYFFGVNYLLAGLHSYA